MEMTAAINPKQNPRTRPPGVLLCSDAHLVSFAYLHYMHDFPFLSSVFFKWIRFVEVFRIAKIKALEPALGNL